MSAIKRKITDEEELKKLEDAIAFRNVSNMPARVKDIVLKNLISFFFLYKKRQTRNIPTLAKINVK